MLWFFSLEGRPISGVVGKFKCPLKKTQPFCPRSTALNWTGKGLRNPCVSQHLCTCLPLFLLGRAKNTQTTYEKWNKSNLVITSSKELNKLCCFKRVSLYVKCMLKVKEKYIKTKYRPVSILLNVNIMIYLKFKLQLKYRNKTYSSIIVNFHTTQYTNFKLKFMKNKGYHVKRSVHWHIVTSLLLNLLTPNDPYMGRTAPLTSKRCILYIYSTNIGTEYFKHALYSPFFFSSKCSLFHNANLFGYCIIHILYTECAKI